MCMPTQTNLDPTQLVGSKVQTTHKHGTLVNLFLGLAVNQQEQPPVVVISRIKSIERKDNKDRESYRRVKTWRLTELRLVDGRSAETEVPEFDLHFDKNTFKWIASGVVEKKVFITCLYKVLDLGSEMRDEGILCPLHKISPP